LAKLQGITFSKYRQHSVGKDTRRYTFEGSSFGFCFRAEFDVSETTKEVQPGTILLEVHQDTARLLENYLPVVIAERAVLPFFENFSSLASIMYTRKQLFLDLKKSFPANTVVTPSGPHGSVLHFVPSNSFHYVFVWDIFIDKTGNILQNTTLVPKVSRQHVLLDQRNVLAIIADQFPSFVKQKGLKAALVILFKASLGTWNEL